MPLPDQLDGPNTPVRYRIRHTTRYDYVDPVSVSHHLLHLQARSHPLQRCRRSQLIISPVPAARADGVDFFGNPVTYLEFQEPHQSLSISAESEVEVRPPPPFTAAATPPWEHLRNWLSSGADPGAATEVDQFACDSTLIRVDPILLEYAQPSFPAGRPIGEAAIDLLNRIHGEFTFDPTATTVATPLMEAMLQRRGVCQDFAHILIGCLRSLGLPGRYISGYLRTLPPPGRPRLVGADVSHAWVSVWVGGTNWLDLCPANGRIANEDYITVAWGRDYQDVSPVRGVIQGGGQHVLKVEVDVEMIESTA